MNIKQMTFDYIDVQFKGQEFRRYNEGDWYENCSGIFLGPYFSVSDPGELEEEYQKLIAECIGKQLRNHCIDVG